MLKRLLVLLTLAGGAITHAHAQTYPGVGPLNPILGVDPTGTIDATAVIHNAAVAGGGLLPCGTYKIGSTLGLFSNSRLVGAARGCVTLKWTGATNSDIIVTPSQTTNLLLENLVIDANNITGLTGLHLVDTSNSRFTGLTFQSTGASSNSGTAIRLQAGSGGTGASFNNVFNVFTQISSIWYNIGFQCDGVSTGPTVVTLNTLTQIDFEKVTEGFRFAQWCDNNRFYHVRVETEVANAIGVVNNDSGTPGSDVGVYANNFYGLAVDAFGAASNVSAWFSNVSKQNFVYGLYHSPDTFPGSLVVDNAGRSASHYIVLENIGDGTNNSQIITKNIAPGSSIGRLRACVTGVNFNSANTDNAVSISAVLAGVNRYAIDSVRISNASASISTATIGVFNGAGGTGQTIAANQAITVTATATGTNNNTMSLTLTNGNTEAYNDTALQVRIGTAQGSAATADVCVYIVPLS